MCNFAILRQIFYEFYLQCGKFFLMTKGGQQKNSWDKGRVNKVSGRRGDPDITLQEGVTVPSPPTPCPHMTPAQVGVRDLGFGVIEEI